MSSGPPVIAVDAMGGDHGPAVVVEGACRAVEEGGAIVELVGDPDIVFAHLGRIPHPRARIRVVPSRGVVPMNVEAREALTEHAQASLLVATRRVSASSGAEALVTAGPTGAAVLACAQAFRRLPGVRRTALAAVIPTERRTGHARAFTLLIDAGATLRVDASDLATFACMGAAYASVVANNPEPTVALLSNGTEPVKGTPEIVAAHHLLGRVSGVRFVGNVESLHIPRGEADVVVCDGFTGNVALKMLEGIAEVLAGFTSRTRRPFRDRFALWLLRGTLREVRQVIDWEHYGGAPILGFDRLCIKAHGRSGPRAIYNAIRVAETCVRANLCRRIALGLERLEFETLDSSSAPRG